MSVKFFCKIFLFLIIILLFLGCAGSIKTVIDENYNLHSYDNILIIRDTTSTSVNVDSTTNILRNELINRGYNVFAYPHNFLKKTNSLILVFTEHWQWDFGNYLKFLKMTFYDFKNGKNIAVGSFLSLSQMHNFPTAESEVPKILSDIFKKQRNVENENKNRKENIINIPPIDEGDIQLIKKDDSTIIYFPFIVISDVDGTIERTRYPNTETDINKYIYELLSEKIELVTDDTTESSITFYKYLIQSTEDSIYQNIYDINKWNQYIPNGKINDDTFIYFPIGIETERDHSVAANLFVLLFDNKGNIAFSRMIPYNPLTWSGNIQEFVNDTMGILPLCF